MKPRARTGPSAARLQGRVAAAFEVEHTTSIYSGIVRLLDLALGAAAPDLAGLFLVAPDDREDEVRAQLRRPAFARVSDLHVQYLPYGDLAKNREAIARFGSGMKAIHAIARSRRIDLAQLLNERFRVARPDDLALRDASQLIDELKGNNPGGTSS